MPVQQAGLVCRDSGGFIVEPFLLINISVWLISIEVLLINIVVLLISMEVLLINISVLLINIEALLINIVVLLISREALLINFMSRFVERRRRNVKERRPLSTPGRNGHRTKLRIIGAAC